MVWEVERFWWVRSWIAITRTVRSVTNVYEFVTCSLHRVIPRRSEATRGYLVPAPGRHMSFGRIQFNDLLDWCTNILFELIVRCYWWYGCVFNLILTSFYAVIVWVNSLSFCCRGVFIIDIKNTSLRQYVGNIVSFGLPSAVNVSSRRESLPIGF